MKFRRKEIDLSAERVAELLGVSPATIYRYEKGDIEKLPVDRLAPIATALQTTPGYLMGWEDDNGGYTCSNVIPMPTMSKTPLIGAIACGAPILAQEHIEDYVDTPKNIHADFALICKGDSMINARIFDGDVVYVRQQVTVENGEIAAVLIDNEATLKRVRIFEDHIVLEPENPHYRPLSFWGDEMNDIQILGKAVAFTSTVL